MRRLIIMGCAPVAFMSGLQAAAKEFNYDWLLAGTQEEQPKSRVEEYEPWRSPDDTAIFSTEIHSSALQQPGPEFEESPTCDTCSWNVTSYSHLPERLVTQFYEVRKKLISVQKKSLGMLFKLVLQSPRDASLFEVTPLDASRWILLGRFYYVKSDLHECLELQCIDSKISEDEQDALQQYNNALHTFHQVKKQLKVADTLRKKNPYIVDDEGSVRLVIENEGVLFWLDEEGCMHVADAASIYL